MNSPVLTEHSAVGDLLSREYRSVAGVYDEFMTANAELRLHWERLSESLQEKPLKELDRRQLLADQLVYENGVTFNVRPDSDDRIRPWTLNVLPVVFAESDWSALSDGLEQRGQLLQLILADLYGPRSLLHRRLLPPEIVYANRNFLRPAVGMATAARPWTLPMYSADLARSSGGNWWVMADRTASAIGCGYALENRTVISQTWPQLIQDCHVQRLASFFRQLQSTLLRLSPRNLDNPHVVFLSPGPNDPYYFEDAFLARYLGYRLVEGGDLAVRDDKVWLKTLGGLMPVDVIFRRVFERQLDPLELDGTSTIGIPGLLQCVRKGTVSIVNPIGSELVESPVFMAFLPQLCRELLGEELKLPSIATWWCNGVKERQYVLDHFDNLVIKPAFDPSGGEEIIVNRLSETEKSQLRDRIKKSPAKFVAQETIVRSTAPTWRDGQLAKGHIALRTFGVRTEDSFSVMPGGLIRVSSTPDPIELSIAAGDESKDAWVLSDHSVPHVSLLPQLDTEIPLERIGAALPSRVADNLYWLGRHLEQVDSSARIVRFLVDRLTVEASVENDIEISAWVRVLATRGLIEPGYAVEELSHTLPALQKVLLNAVYEDEERMSLRQTVRGTLRLASLVRDRVSLDTWRMVNRMEHHFRRVPTDSDRDLGDVLSHLNQLVFDIASCYGLATDSMTRGQAWRFLDIGRRIERGLQMVTLLRETLAHHTEEFVPLLQSVLDVADSSVTYRTRYLSRIRRVPVLDLLMTDETNPRSLGFQLMMLEEHVDHLPKDRKQATRTAEQKSVLSALHHIRMADVHELGESKDGQARSLNQLLLRVEHELMTLSTLLTRRYLVHSGPPRHLQEFVGPVS